MTLATTRAIATEHDIVIERTVNAPRDLVWKAWTDPDLLQRWWGPKTFTAPFWELDLRVGGVYRYCMRAPDGKDYWGGGVYREIDPLRRIVATDTFTDAQGKVVPASYYGMTEDVPLELLVTVTFEEHKGKTLFTLRHSGMPAGAGRDGARQGWNEALDKLAEYLGQA
jgi:uncharacterized protein YndB with AHSA1/START domain